jgi:hypothetical protein
MAGQVIGGHIATRTLTADKIAANSLTVTEIWGLARINGNRLNVYASGSISVPTTAGGATVVHNLGRQAVLAISSPTSFSGGTETNYKGIGTSWIDIINNGLNSFTLKNVGASTLVVNYAYI